MKYAQIQTPEYSVFYSRINQGVDVHPGHKYVVEFDYGLDVSEVLKRVDIPKETKNFRIPGFRIIRAVNANDLHKIESNKIFEDQAYAYFRELLDDDEDEMYVKIVKTRFSLDRRRLFFRYIAKAPLNLTRFIDPIQSMLNCGVNLWQVGVRDECRLIGCIGSCGRQSCCSSWQKRDCPVNLKMAKNQGIALNPGSLNGSCNRLKCCLQYENHIYEEAGIGIPAIGVKVICPGRGNVKGTIIKRDVLRGRVVVRDSEGKFMTIPFEEVEIIK